jgi:flagellar FliL protein
MSESNEAQANADKPAKKGGSKLIIILALVNFVAVLGLGGYLVYSQRQAAAQPGKAGEKADKAKAEGEHAAEGEPAAEAEHEAEPQEGEHEAPAKGHGKAGEEEGKASAHDDAPAGRGPLLAIEAMVTNMADPDSDRYLKVGIQFRLSSEAAKAEVEASLVPVRNQLLLYLSSLTIADTTGADNKREIQKTVKRIANESMPSSRITQVYFTEFVIQ